MEHANPVKTPDIPEPGVPSKVRMSTLPDPEATRGKTLDKSQFRVVEESKRAEVEVEKKPEVVPTPTPVSSTEPKVKGTIVITVYENHPYDVEFSGQITGRERDLAWRFMLKQYNVWKAKLAKEDEARLKQEALNKERKEGGK